MARCWSCVGRFSHWGVDGALPRVEGPGVRAAGFVLADADRDLGDVTLVAGRAVRAGAAVDAHPLLGGAVVEVGGVGGSVVLGLVDGAALGRSGAVPLEPAADDPDLEVSRAGAVAGGAVGHPHRDGQRPGLGLEEPAHKGLRCAVAALAGELLEVEAVEGGVRGGNGADVLQGAGMLGVVADVAEQERPGGEPLMGGENEQRRRLVAASVGAGVQLGRCGWVDQAVAGIPAPKGLGPGCHQVSWLRLGHRATV